MQTSVPTETVVPPVTDRDSSFAPQKIVVFLLVLFALALLPIIPSASKFHGDERFYTDAAVQMVKTGDYWTPFYPDGHIRLLKPILTYWAAAGSFKLFGISLFSARLPFLLAGVLVVWLTCQLARTVLKCDRTALLAALIIASNVELMTVSTRATPDALVSLFVLISMWGFARIWFQKDESLVGPLLAWGGMGLAVQTKGLLGLCPLGAMALFWIAARPESSRLKHLFRWPAILAGLALGVFWYGVMLQRHGAGSFQDFYSDQVGAKISPNLAFILKNFAVYLFAGFRHCLPWTLLLVAGLLWGRKELVAFLKRNRSECLFLISLFVVLVCIFGLGNMRRARYLTASYPMLSVFLAGTITSLADQAGVRLWLRRIVGILAPLVAIAGMGLLIAGVGSDWRLAIAGATLAAVGIAGLLAARAVENMWKLTWIAGLPVIGFAVFGACVRPVFSPSAMASAADTLMQANPRPGTVHTWQVNETDAAQIRLLTDGGLTIKAMGTNASGPDLGDVRAAITTSPHQSLFENAGYRTSRVVTSNTAFATSWLGRTTAKHAAKSHKRAIPTYWIASRPEQP